MLCHGEVFKLGRRPYALAGGYWEHSRRSARNRVLAAILPRRSTGEYLQLLIAEPAHAAIGFKLMLNQCKSRPYIWPLVTAHSIRAVLVSRQNVLKTLVSRRVAEATGVYHVSQSLRSDRAATARVASRIRIGTASLSSDLRQIEEESAEWRRRLEHDKVPHIEIVYENYARDIDKGNERVQAFLGVGQRKLHSDLEKVNPDGLADVIENYDEVARTLRQTQYAYCLDKS